LKFVSGLILGLLLVPLLVYLYFTGGSAPVATTDSDMPFESFLARKAQHARIDKDMPKTVPIQATEPNYLAGAELYKQHCAVCHGVPLTPKTAIATGMYPHPPQLFEGKGVTDDEPGETYWKIANGFRLTGMPGFSKSLTDTQMWQMSLLLANADKLPASVKTALVAAPPSPAPASSVPSAASAPATSPAAPAGAPVGSPVAPAATGPTVPPPAQQPPK
jgi:mono/diheme cytochrome c family protein